MTAAGVPIEEACIAELIERTAACADPSKEVTEQVFAATLAEWRAVTAHRVERSSLWRFWWRHEWLLLVIFAMVATVFALTHADVSIAHALFFDRETSHWIGAESWWVNDVIHDGGRWFVRGIVAIALLVWIVTCVRSDLRSLRRPAAYFVIAAVLSVGIVGLLKITTNVDCPWDLSEFGGRFPAIALFADRPDDLRTAHCFPAAHASSGYALLALYFLLRERHALVARLGLALGVLVGLLFGIAQQARGAHFVSHDVWSAFLVWTISLSVYTFAFKAELWE